VSPKELAAFRATLLNLRAEALATEPAKIEPNRKDVSSVGVADEDEQALSEMMQTLASQRNKKQAELVGQIDRALGKLEHSAELFGLCEDCEEEIPGKRLELRPYVTLCAECQAKHDPKRGTSRRGLTDFK
jgi:DnaK suppressor protein